MTFCSYIPPSDAEACCDEAELQEELAEQGAAEGVEPDEEAHKAQRPAEQDAIGHTVHEAHDRAARVVEDIGVGYPEGEVRDVADGEQGYAKAVIIDSGCGEGYYTAAAAKAAPQATILGIDISKEAAKLAAKRCKSAKIAVASAFHLPTADNSIDMLLEVFSPYCATEFDRVLKPGGIFLEVIPGENHLFALKSAVYDEPYKNQVDKFERPGFTLLEVQSVSGEIRLTSQTDIQNLFLMTP